MKRFLSISLVLILAGASASPLTDLYNSLEPDLARFYDSPRDNLLDFNDFAARDPQAAVAALERAQKVAAEGEDEFPELSRSLNEYLEQAKAAVTFRDSAADLELRLWSVRGVLAKALYQEAAQLAAAGDAEASLESYQGFVSVAARTLDLEEKAKPLILAGDSQGLELLSQRALAYASNQTFGLAQQAENRDQAFALGSKGYGLMLAAESSEWADRDTINSVADGLASLASGELDAFQQVVTTVQAQSEAYLVSTENAIMQALADAESVAAASSSPSEAPTEVAETSQGPETVPGPEIATSQEPAVDTDTNPSPEPAAPETEDEVAPVSEEVAQPADEVTLASPTPGPRLVAATLEEELAQLPQSQEVLSQMGLALGAQGYDSVLGWLDQVSEVRGVIASGQSFAQTGDSESARIYLEYALTRYNLQILPIAEIYNPGLTQRTQALFNRMVSAPAIRTSDIAVLVGELQEVEESLFGSTLGAGQAALVTIEQLTLGLPRAAVFILAGLLAVFPIYLLQITFGRVSRYWRYVQYAFFFLLLPALLEALSYIGSLLATYGGLPALGFLSNLSILQNVGTQLLWGVLLLLVVIFATIGWYGLATQFGVLRERGPATSIENPTGYDATNASSSRVTSSTTTTVEWDPEEDEF